MKKFKFYFLTVIFIFLSLGFNKLPSLEAGNKINNPISVEEITFPYGIGLKSQPFFNELETKYEKWKNNPIAPGTGKSPKETILNFYSLMALAGDIENEVYNKGKKEPGFFWSKETKKKIQKGEILFIKAAQTLDSSSFAPSVREPLSDEAAVELKHILDYIFNSSKTKIYLPDYEDLNSLASDEKDEWKLPDSKISLKRSDGNDGFVTGQYYFSDYTVRNIRYAFKKIEYQAESLPSDKYTTPNFYLDFVHTPGLLVPPKWYASLPDSVHNFFEIEIIGNQTIFQIFFAFLTILIYSLVIINLTKKIKSLSFSEKDNWTKSYLSFIPIPITKFSELFIDQFLNFTGNTLIVLTFTFEILYFLTIIIFIIFLFEALTNFLLSSYQKKSKGISGNKYIENLRIRTLIKPISRFTSLIFSAVLIYNLMLSLSVPLNIILFLSTVPGIALGLGASKLFGNVISGLAMQADQHLNVGNFCKVGDTLGYVKRVGLRSIDIQTYEACVTIPNSYAEGTNVINYSTISDGLIKQSINLRIELVKVFLPGQKKELIRLLLEFLNKDETYSNPIVSIDNDGDKTILIIYALIINKEWREFVDIRNELNVKADEIIMQVYLSRFIVGISYDTKPAQLDEIPIIIEDIVDQIDDLQFDGCNLGQINEFSYDFVVCIVGKLKTYGNFLKRYDKLNKLLISKFEERGISIPFPTTTFDQKNI